MKIRGTTLLSYRFPPHLTTLKYIIKNLHNPAFDGRIFLPSIELLKMSGEKWGVVVV